MVHNFKEILPVPSSKDFVDIILSSTQRKTPTVIHKGYSIQRIRSFYMRKVKFTATNYQEKIEQILLQFPKVDDLHPFYGDLMNVLYDKDHYKLALGQLSTAKHLIEAVAKDYVRLLKYGDSLYRCKQLKRAALGRMCTIMRKQAASLAYLEQVRLHLSRLPSIDPNGRTLLVCGYPNVGKSSFMNKVTRANVEVQPYAFTTKSLYVGHMDYKYLRWQVIDTPGILDHPLEERNTIEMQSITAMAHLRASIIYFCDPSEQCGFPLEKQIDLFNSIRPLFANKPLVVAVNKIDIVRPEQWSKETKKVMAFFEKEGVKTIPTSTLTEEGISSLKEWACDRLLEQRVEAKMKGKKAGEVVAQMHITEPRRRDNKDRPAFVPEAVAIKRAAMADEPVRTERDLEREAGGYGVYDFDLKKHYDLRNPDWKYDIVPEIMDGKNIADFIDSDIWTKLEELERQEAEQEAEWAATGAVDEQYVVGPAEAALLKQINRARELKRVENQLKKKGHKGATVTMLPRTIGDFAEAMEPRGINIEETEPVLRARGRKRGDMERDDSNAGEGSDEAPRKKKRMRSTTRDLDRSLTRSRSAAPHRPDVTGLASVSQKATLTEDRRMKQAIFRKTAKRGEADRAITNPKPKHLFSGKRTQGTHDRR